MRALPVLAFAISSPLALAQSKTDPARCWSQPHGNAFGTSFVDVEPLSTEPEIDWSVDLGTAASEPVSWGSVVFVAVKSGGFQLRAFDVAKGDLVGSGSIGKEAPEVLFSCEGLVGVATKAEVVLYRLDVEARRVVEARRFACPLSAPPRVHAGVLYAQGASVVLVSTLASGANRGSLEGAGAIGALRLGGAWGPAAFASVSARDGSASLRVVEIDDLGAVQLKTLGRSEFALGAFDPATAADLALARLQPAGSAGAWLVSHSGGSWLVTEGAQPKSVPAPFAGSVGAQDGVAFGFDATGAFVRMETSGSVSTVAPASEAPRGVVTLARGVAYAGSRAIDLASGAVLWTSKKLDATRRAYPLGDKRLVTLEAKGKLVGWGPKRATKGSNGNGAANATRPGSGDGVVRADGTRIAGEVTQTEGGYRVVDAEGRAHELSAKDVALVETGGTVKREGEESAVLAAWRTALYAGHRERVVESFGLFLAPRLTDDCKRLLDEAKSCGLDSARVAELEKKLAATKPNTNSNKDGQRKKPLEKENALRAESYIEFAQAAAWCAANAMPLAGSALQIEAGRRAPAETRADEVLATMVPESFPWATDADAVAKWKLWVPHLVSSGAQFVPKSEGIWKRIRAGAWSKGAVVLRTRHVMLCSRDSAPEIVGGCLDAAEAAIGLLHTIVPPAADANREPLVVRLLYDREEYLHEGSSFGMGAPEHTAGYYSPGERISRFYVPRGDEGRDLLGRGLFSTVAHELTHHYLDIAWLSPKDKRAAESSTRPGQWIVEGFATFVQDDVVAKLEAGAGAQPKDPVCAYLSKSTLDNGKLFDIGRLIDLSRGEFDELSHETLFMTPTPLDSSRAVLMNEKLIFYQQSATLVFFLMYRAGPQVRAKLAEYVRAQYLGVVQPQGWKVLGFDDPKALDAAFREYVTLSDG